MIYVKLYYIIYVVWNDLCWKSSDVTIAAYLSRDGSRGTFYDKKREIKNKLRCLRRVTTGYVSFVALINF